MKLSNILLLLICAVPVGVMGMTYLDYQKAIQNPVALSPEQIAAEKREALRDLKALHERTRAFPAEPPMRLYTQFYTEVFSEANTRPYYFKYYVYVPRGYDPTQKYPLVLLLHGLSRHQFGGVYILDPRIQQKHPSFVVVPIAPEGMRWGDTDPKTPLLDANPLAMEAVRQVMAKYAIDRERVYVSGYSMGGIGTYGIVEQNPDFFAGAWVNCGGWMAGRAHLFPDDMTILVVHGDQDNPHFARDTVAALRTAGKPVYYREYPGVGHNVWDYAYRDPKIWDLFFSLRRTPKPD